MLTIFLLFSSSSRKPSRAYLAKDNRRGNPPRRRRVSPGDAERYLMTSVGMRVKHNATAHVLCAPSLWVFGVKTPRSPPALNVSFLFFRVGVNFLLRSMRNRAWSAHCLSGSEVSTSNLVSCRRTGGEPVAAGNTVGNFRSLSLVSTSRFEMVGRSLHFVRGLVFFFFFNAAHLRFYGGESRA